MHSIPRGGTALTSPRTFKVGLVFHIFSGINVTPGAPVHRAATAPSRTRLVLSSSKAAAGVISKPNLL